MGRISMPQGKGSQMHNRRDYDKIGQPLPSNIDASRTAQNVTLVDIDIRQAYKEIFGQALDEYNAKQKRADRKINDYCDHIAKSKNGEKLFYEDVVQWGAKEDFDANADNRVRAKEALKEYAQTFEQRNPNLKVIGAYIHMDEASPHLHIDYIPVAHGYTRGLSVRNSIDRAMKEMGFVPKDESRKNNATKLWKERERKAFADICKEHSLCVEPERKARGSLSVEEYKEAHGKMIGEIREEYEEARREMIGDVELERGFIESDVEHLREQLRELKAPIDEIASTGKTILPGVVAVKKKDLETIKEQAKAYTANRNEIDTLRERSAWVEQREQELKQLYQRQLNLNQLLEKSEQDGKAKDKEIYSLKEQIKQTEVLHQKEIVGLKAQIHSLTAQLDEVEKKLLGKINDLADRLNGAYQSITAIVKAVSMLKYDKDEGYKVENLTAKQGKLIDGLAEYGAKWARYDGFENMADDMEKHIGISNGIRKIIEPQVQSHDDFVL